MMITITTVTAVLPQRKSTTSTRVFTVPPSQCQSRQWHPRHFQPPLHPRHTLQTLTAPTASPALTACPAQTARGPQSMGRGWRTHIALWRYSLLEELRDALSLLVWHPGPRFPSTQAPVKCSKHAGRKNVVILQPMRKKFAGGGCSDTVN